MSIQLEPVAIIGIGCRFPGAASPAAFWELLRSGGQAIGEIPASRWSSAAYYDPDIRAAGKMVSRWGAFVDDVDQFDWRAFRISPSEAKHMDPQQRLLLQVTWEALEDAGVTQAQIAGSQTSVCMGLIWNDYLRLQMRDWSRLNGYTPVGAPLAFSPNRISYVFDLRGPSVAIDATCAASLAALHYACQTLWTGEASMALAGGCELMLSPDTSVMLSKAGLFSPDGRCKPFDSSANGFVRGEGGAVLVLKRLCDVAPAERVYALIRAVSIQHNGRNEWIMAASQQGFEQAMRDGCRKAAVDPLDLDYVELHGIGLPKGDQLEAQALGALLRGRERGRPCRVGSVKTNIGHLGAASGVASLVKVALALHHGQIPPTVGLEHVDPAVTSGELGFVLQQELGAWPQSGRAGLAGIMATSFSGSNAYAVLEGAPPVEQPAPEPDGAAHVLAISARSDVALRRQAEAYRALLGGARPAGLGDLCAAAATRRNHYEHRLAAVGRSHAELAAGLERAAQRAAAPPSKRPLLAFVLEAGDGAESLAAWRQLQSEPALLTGDVGRLALQRGLAELWRAWGLAPDLVIGGAEAEALAAGAPRLDPADPDRLDAALAAALAERRGGLLLSLGGAGPLTAGLAERMAARGHSARPLGSLGAGDDARRGLLEALAALYEQGFPVNWDALYTARAHVDLPTYQWQLERMWLEWLDTSPAGAPAAQPAPAEQPEPDAAPELLGRLLSLAPERRAEALRRHLREQISGLLELSDPAALASHQRLFELGFTSISALELRNRLERGLGRALPATLLFDHPTIEALVDYLAPLATAAAPGEPPAAPAPADDDHTLEQIDQLSEDEVEALLLEKLSRIEGRL